MLSRLIQTFFDPRGRAELERFHRDEMREAGVLDDDLRAFLAGR